MGRYFNPPTPQAIEEAGGRVLPSSRDHAKLVSLLNPDERLGIRLDRIAFKQMADVTEPDEFTEFMSQVNAGIVLLLNFYAMPDAAFR